jgi:hypothetical protein
MDLELNRNMAKSLDLSSNRAKSSPMPKVTKKGVSDNLVSNVEGTPNVIDNVKTVVSTGVDYGSAYLKEIETPALTPDKSKKFGVRCMTVAFVGGAIIGYIFSKIINNK